MECPLKVLILGLIPAQLFWEGVMPIRLPGYELNAPASVSVEEDLCVVIPCNFTYKEGDDSQYAALHGYWYEHGKPDSNGAVATNDKSKWIVEDARGRFHLAGNLEEGNCSLIITNARESDEKAYYFRMDKGFKAKFSFRDGYPEPFLNVTNRHAPKIHIKKKLRAGDPVNVTCSTFGSCTWQQPNITWEGFPNTIKPHLSMSGTRVYSSVLDFVPSIADHNRNLTCSVSYTNGSSSGSRQRTIQLNVRFPPQTPLISWKPLLSNQSVQNVTKASRIEVKKGDSILLHCSAEGNPLPNVSWIKGSQLLGTPRPSYNILKLSDMTTEDAGEYKCQAGNAEGSAKSSLQILMSYCNSLISGVTGALIMLGVVILIIGIILASKQCWRKRKVETNSESNPTYPKLAASKAPSIFKDPGILDLSLQKRNKIPQNSESTEESADGLPKDPEDLYYATLTFNALNPVPAGATLEEIQTDYAEIRPYSSQ